MLETVIQITCDGCGETEAYHEMNVTKGAVREYLKGLGWQSVSTLDYCKKCVKNGNAKRRETSMNNYRKEFMWCFWRDSSFHRKDNASAFRPHDDEGQPTAPCWHASPPWFGDKAEDIAVFRRRFKTPEAAMSFADKTWPEQSDK